MTNVLLGVAGREAPQQNVRYEVDQRRYPANEHQRVDEKFFVYERELHHGVQIQTLAEGPEIVGVREVFGVQEEHPTNDLKRKGERDELEVEE